MWTPPPTYVAEHLRAGDAVLVMGAGKSYRIALGLKQALEAGVLDAQRSCPASTDEVPNDPGAHDLPDRRAALAVAVCSSVA